VTGKEFDHLLPIITLLLGAGIGWIVKRSDTRRTEALEAGDILSELPNYVWRQGGDESWINLQVFLSRVRIRLRAAGVPDVVAMEVRRAAVQHWRGVHEVDDDYGSDILAANSDDVTLLNRAVDDAQLWLFRRPNWLRRRRAKLRCHLLEDHEDM
jgi:hypothetical protein